MTSEIRGPTKQTLGFEASCVRPNEFSDEWYGVVFDADGEEIWRSEEPTTNIFAATWAAEQQCKELRKPTEAALERLTSGESAEAIALRLLDKKPGVK